MNQTTALVVLALVVSLIASCAPTQSLTQPQSQKAPLRQPPRQSPLTEAAFTVSPGNYLFYKFSAAERSRVTGRFRASGGSGNDIEVLILDGDQFENWKNRHSTPTYYNSEKVTVGSIDVTLREGTYYLIFSNKFSAISNKAITADIKLTDP